MPMVYNKNPISLREGKVFIDGVCVVDSITCQIDVTPDVWTGRQLGEMTPSSRWLGYAVTGTITRRRSTNWLEQKIKQYKNSRETPEFTLTGLMNDASSDYYASYGANTVTVVGCVLTGALPLTRLDSGGEVVEDSLAFNGKDIM